MPDEDPVLVGLRARIESWEARHNRLVANCEAKRQALDAATQALDRAIAELRHAGQVIEACQLAIDSWGDE